MLVSHHSVSIIIDVFYFTPKMRRYFVNILKLNYGLVICIAKSVIATTLKMIFSIFEYLKIWNLRVQKNLNIEKIIFKFV